MLQRLNISQQSEISSRRAGGKMDTIHWSVERSKEGSSDGFQGRSFANVTQVCQIVVSEQGLSVSHAAICLQNGLTNQLEEKS